MSLFIITGVAVFTIGLVGVILQNGFFHKLVSINIFTSGIFLILISGSAQNNTSDPVAVALVLTGLVVTLGSSAFCLMLIRAYFKRKNG